MRPVIVNEEGATVEKMVEDFLKMDKKMWLEFALPSEEGGRTVRLHRRFIEKLVMIRDSQIETEDKSKIVVPQPGQMPLELVPGNA